MCSEKVCSSLQMMVKYGTPLPTLNSAPGYDPSLLIV